MARNQEKAQSMLYRFRQAQAIEMGVERPSGTRRPRMASSVSSLKECEKWRGEILKEISRKVSKIQDAGLTDYAIRDLNDEINKLMREKIHWERQIVTLGGANYHRARTSMVDDQGKEVPGTRGYKYFGRAKELPGVKEMFEKGPVSHENEASARAATYQKFKFQGPEYFGDIDELDEDLVREEREMEQRDWVAAFDHVADVLGLPEDESPPPFPRATIAQSQDIASGGGPKRQRTEDEETTGATDDKRSKTTSNSTTAGGAISIEAAAAANVASFMGVIDMKSLQPPIQPTKEQMEKILLDARKQALLAEYGV